MGYKSQNVGSGSFHKTKARERRVEELEKWCGPMEEHTKMIPIGNNIFCKVDSLYFDMFMKWHWIICGNNYVGRSQRVGRKNKWISMHRMLCDSSMGTVDHINKDTLDNRRHNLRPATYSQNNAFSKRISKSKYRGVWWDSKRKRFRVSGRHGEKKKIIGYFKDEKEAAKSYNEWAIKYHGEFAVLNHVT